MQNLSFIVNSDLADKGIKVKMAKFSVDQISKRRGSELEKHIEKIVKSLDFSTLLTSPILSAYREFYKNFSSDFLPPAEHLLQIAERSDSIPNINKVVDCYNIVSLETLLSIGAHDLANIQGDIIFGFCRGNEKYTPLGKDEIEKVNEGEYVCMDNEKVICRMDVKQCNETKVGSETKEFIIYVQGNKETDDNYVMNGLVKVCENIQQYCGGKYEII